MNIATPYFKLYIQPGELLTPNKGIELLKFIEFNARISHRSEAGQSDTSWRRFIQAVILDHGDWSVAEHAHVNALIRTDRGVLFELTRHRMFSFTVESTRFVNYTKKHELEFIMPEGLKNEDETIWRDSVAASSWAYNELLHKGYPPQLARSVLPNSLACTISCTGNLRNWRHFLLMRTSRETHPDVKSITVPMLAEFKRLVPLLFDDIEPEARQIDNLKKAR